MTIIVINEKKYTVDGSQNILQNCLSLGMNIPYFCWHPVLGSIGACRQCAIILYDNENDLKGRIVMSCMTPSINNIRVTINSDEIQSFRKSILELLMLNHPHDCPICSEGGNCHLQDMTVMTQHMHRRFRFEKRTYKNQDLGSFITHEMNRCITCYRCVRYYKDYAQGTDFNVYGISNNIYFGRIEDGSLESEHSGNLIEICPTGVFTDKTTKDNYNRKWDLQYAPSVCHFCSVGCNIIVGERDGQIKRIENRYNYDVNGHFICDLGRFSYGFVNLKNRPEVPMLYQSNQYVYVDSNQAIEYASNILKKSTKIIGIGSTRSSIENNYSLLDLVGKENFSCGISKYEQSCMQLILEVLESNEFNVPTLHEIEDYDAIIVIGEDLTMTSPRISLALRQAIKKNKNDITINKNIEKWHELAIQNVLQDFKNSLFITNIKKTKLDDIATWNYIASIAEQKRFIVELANKIRNQSYLIKLSDPILIEKIIVISKILILAKKPLIISGSHSRNVDLLRSSVFLAQTLKKINSNVGIVLLTANANSIGCFSLSKTKKFSIEEAIDLFLNTKKSILILMENDLHRYLSKEQLNSVFKNKCRIIVLDHLNTKSIQKGGLILPSTNLFESTGTIVNYEGRAQRFFKAFDPKFYNERSCKQESWRWLQFIKNQIGIRHTKWKKLDDIILHCSLNFPQLKKVKKAAPSSSFRILGQKIPRSPHRFSGRTALRSHISIHEPRQPQDLDTMFSFSMEGSNQFNLHSSHIPYIWNPGWNSPQAWNKLSNETSSNFPYRISGIRLFNSKKRRIQYNLNTSVSSDVKTNQLQVVIYYLFFGSEEMSQYSPIIKKNIKNIYGIINSKDAQNLELKTDMLVKFYCKEEFFIIAVKLSDDFPKGFIGLPLGNNGIPFSLEGKKIKYCREVR